MNIELLSLDQPCVENHVPEVKHAEVAARDFMGQRDLERYLDAKSSADLRVKLRFLRDEVVRFYNAPRQDRAYEERMVAFALDASETGECPDCGEVYDEEAGPNCRLRREHRE